MSTHIWLRAETKPGEARTALTPATARKLVDAGFHLTVERSDQAALPAQAFADAGCDLAAPGAWQSAPASAWILGLKELPSSNTPLAHRHIYFAHAYKQQAGWQGLLQRFQRGGGQLLDLEYLVDAQGRRLAAFGHWAGFVGAALALLTWCGRQSLQQPPLPRLHPWQDQSALLDQLNIAVAPYAEQLPRLMVIGAGGRVGRGAIDLAERMQIPVTAWDLPETKAGGPFPAILDHELFLNAVLATGPQPPFLDAATLARGGQLAVIADVSCDPYGDCNPLPVYNECTTLDAPLITLPGGQHLIAIDHLPSLLPRESSEDFAGQLLPLLLQLNEDSDGVWQRAAQLFDNKCVEALT